ncbi:ATP-binding protein [Streptomyces sp. CA-256286]|uniref:ATP-binding protein n=1 Tax=Streptomyces sp. CA-256286 TaxID=2801033 RepID=UPI001A98D1C2|nr:ATP-binding protein [Streptomyces sp. CA-256286]QTA36720.1 Histidine kinase-like ATPase domain protein [Streptomyces sp. CA-256286]
MTLTALGRAEPTAPLDGTRSTPAVRLCVVSLERTTRPGQALSDTDRCRPQQFRHLSCALLTSWDLLGHIASVELLVTELLTNALQHGEGPEVDVMISADDDYLHVFVRDGSPRTPHPRPLDMEAENGRGLHLVTAIADEIEVSKDGTTVHCTLALQAGAA